MANKHYNDFTNPGDLQDTDIWAFDRSPFTANHTFKTTPLNILNYINSKILPGNEVFVNETTGSDLNNGSILYPFATLSAALSSITTNSSSNTFVITMQNGVYSETDLAFKPFVFINGNGAKLTVTNSVTFDPSWASGGTLLVGNFSELSVTGVNLDLEALSAPNSTIKFDNIIITSSSNWTIKFDPSNTNSSLLVNEVLEKTGSSTIFEISNANGSYTNSTIGFQYNSTSPNDNLFTIIGGVIGHDLDITNSSSNNVIVLVSGGLIGEFRNITNTSSGTIELIEANTLTLKPITITGSGSFWATTNASDLPILAGGATQSNVQYVTISDSINANYVSPTNYSPIDISVNGHLRGINNALGSLTISLPSTQIAFGSLTNTLTSSSDFEWDDSTKLLEVQGGITVGSTSIDPSSLIDVTSTTKGTRPYSLMTTAQRNAISSPANALFVYDTDASQLYMWNSSSWVIAA